MNAIRPLSPESDEIARRWWPGDLHNRPITAATRGEFMQRMTAMQIDLIERWRPTMPPEHKRRAAKTLKALRKTLWSRA